MEIHLTFHGLGTPARGIPEDEVRYWTPTERFKQILDLIKRAKSPTHITFDDGNTSDVEIALPLLKAASLRASFFIVTDRIDQAGYLTAADIRKLGAAGMEIGSHGTTHVRWTSLSNSALSENLSRSLDMLGSILKEKVQTVAVPFGACDVRILRVLRRHGIQRVYSGFRGPALANAWVVPRNSITTDTSMSSISNLLSKNYNIFDIAEAALRQWWRPLQAYMWPTH